MRSLSIALTAVSLICLFAAPAYALRANTYVASYGADSGGCSFSAPCRTFGFALSQVQAGGVVTAIDSAGNSPFTITKSVTIMAPPGVSPSIQTPAGNSAITIQVGANDTVILRGLTLEGENSAFIGIEFDSGEQLEIYDCVVHAFTQQGISVVTNAPTSVVISNTTISGMIAQDAIGIDLLGIGNGTISAVLDHITANNNQIAIGVEASAPSVEALIADSSLNNNIYGVAVVGCEINGSGIANAILRNVRLNQIPNPISVDQCSNTWISHVVQTLTPPLAYNPGVIFKTHTNVHVFSDGTNLTSAPPSSFEPWGVQ